MSNAKTVMSQAANTWAGPTYIEDVFSTYLYDGGSNPNTITNGIDLAGEGGLVWTKCRNTVPEHALTDTERGKDYTLSSNTTNASVANGGGLSSFNSDGYTITVGDSRLNNSGSIYASWTFRKAPRFFDVVTYTGDGDGTRRIPHNLGVVPGFIIVKRTDSTSNWSVAARLNDTQYTVGSSAASLYLNVSNVGSNAFTTATYMDETSFQTNAFYRQSTEVNAVGASYVAYVFAHDPLGPTGDGTYGLISCGSYTGNGSSNGPAIDLGWEPQLVLVKNASSNSNWIMLDNMRGMVSINTNSQRLMPNLTTAESKIVGVELTSTGFKCNDAQNETNASGSTYIYMAIRRGPMRQPESGNEVFSPFEYTSDNTDYRLIDTGILTDTVFARTYDNISSLSFVVGDRLRGNAFLGTAVTAVENTSDADSFMAPTSLNYGNAFSTMTGFGAGNDATRKINYSTNLQIAYAWKRAPGFFDVVAYTGNSVTGRTVSHNLGVSPELILVKNRIQTYNWTVYCSELGNDKRLYLNLTDAESTTSTWNNTDPTATDFTVSNGAAVNTVNVDYIAYLFATLPGVSKVGSYTGNGTNQTIDCGFTSGARFVLIKRTDASSNWKVMDTARGIVTGDDKILELDNTAAETTFDIVDPDPSGFIVEGNTTQGMNQSGASYIFYAIA